MTATDWAASIGLLWYSAIGTIALGGWFCTFFIYNRGRRPEETSLQNSLHGVSILRPMRGLEPMLEQCLASAFQSTCDTDFEIILSVADGDDPAVAIAQKVMAQYPLVPSQLIVGDEDVGPNPKINNLVRSYRESKHTIMWILDSNTWVSPGTLQRAIAHFNDPKVNLVHHIPVAHALENCSRGAQLDDVYMGTMHAKMYSIINYLNVAPCVMGKSNLLRKSALGDAGLTPFAKYIAEDHLIATQLWHGRGSHVLGTDCVRQPLEEVSLESYAKRRIRWVRVRKYMVTASTLVEPFTECFIHGLIGAFSIRHLKLSAAPVWVLFSVHVAIWAGLDYICWTHLHQLSYDADHPFHQGAIKTPFEWLYHWFIREVIALPLWIAAMLSDKIDWRGSQFVIARDMTARRVS